MSWIHGHLSYLMSPTHLPQHHCSTFLHHLISHVTWAHGQHTPVDYNYNSWTAVLNFIRAHIHGYLGTSLIHVTLTQSIASVLYSSYLPSILLSAFSCMSLACSLELICLWITFDIPIPMFDLDCVLDYCDLWLCLWYPVWPSFDHLYLIVFFEFHVGYCLPGS